MSERKKVKILVQYEMTIWSRDSDITPDDIRNHRDGSFGSDYIDDAIQKDIMLHLTNADKNAVMSQDLWRYYILESDKGE